MKRIILLLSLSHVALSVCLSPLLDAVEVVSTSGDCREGQPLTISGSRFGAHADNSPGDSSTLAVKFDDFDNGVEGEVIGNGWGNLRNDPKYSTANQRLGSSLSTYHHFHDNIYACHFGFRDLDWDEVYITYWRRLDITYLQPPTNFKEFRIEGDIVPGNYPMMAYATNYGPGSYPMQNFWLAGNGHEGDDWDCGTCKNRQWDRKEFWIRIGDDPGQGFKFWENATLLENYTMPQDFPQGVGEYLGDNNSKFDYFAIGFYMRTGSEGVTQFDDVYVDITQARVEIGDNATWEQCTYREIQIPSAWSDTSITVTVNQGAFKSGAQAYLYVVDADGNVNTSGFPITFAGGPQPLTDLTPPFVSGQSPAPNQQNMPVDTSVVLHVQDSGDAVDVNSIQMQVNGQAVTLQITGSPSDYAVSYTPSSPFAYDSVVTVAVNAQDLHSPPNVMQQVSYSFTTQPGDSTPPVVTGQSPAPDQQNVPVDASIVLHVQDSGDGVDVNSIQMQVNGQPVTPQITGSHSDYTVSYTAGSPFAYGSVVTVMVNAQDFHNPPNVMSAVTYSFTTQPPPPEDSTAPVVTEQSPAPGQQNVRVDTSIVLHVQDSGDGVDVNSIQMQVNGQPVTPQITGTPSDYTVTYTAGAPFAYDSAVVVIVNAQDLHIPPNVMSAVTYSFHTQPEGIFSEEWGEATNSDHPGTLEDTFININSENSAADATNLNTYTWPANSIANAILMKFELSAIPQNATVISAKLRLYMFEASNEPTYNISVHKIVNVAPVIAAATGYTYDGANAWTPYDGLYNNIPLGQADIAAPEDTNAVDTTPGYTEWTVTSMVSEWVADPVSNRGLMLNSDPTAASDAHRYFRPSEYADAAQRPGLVITYSFVNPPLPGPPGKPIHVD